jgi:hypothetical protein
MSRAALLDVLRADARELDAALSSARSASRAELLELVARAARLYLLCGDAHALGVRREAEDSLREALTQLRRAT